MNSEDVEVLKNKVKELEKYNNRLEEELELKNNNYKKLTIELGQVIFQNEDYEYKIKKQENKINKLKENIIILEKENEELKLFKKEVESTKLWKLRSKIK